MTSKCTPSASAAPNPPVLEIPTKGTGPTTQKSTPTQKVRETNLATRMATVHLRTLTLFHDLAIRNENVKKLDFFGPHMGHTWRFPRAARGRYGVMDSTRLRLGRGGPGIGMGGRRTYIAGNAIECFSWYARPGFLQLI
jgi:hypothetical protein